MKKWILIGSGVVVVITIVLLVTVVSNLGPMIKTAVNTYGPDITKTEVHLGDVSISIFSAEAELKDFLLGNPNGFKSPYAMKVGSVNVNVDEKSIAGDTIIIDKIEVVAPDISYERSGGRDNFQTILNNVKKNVGADKQAAKKKSDKKDAGKKILIRNFIVKDGKVNLIMSMLTDKTISAPLPDIHLKDIGKEKGGTSPAEAFDEVLNALYGKITSPSVTDTLNQSLKALVPSAGSLGESAAKELEGATEKIKTVEEAGKGVKAVTDKFKGLLGK